MPTPGRLEVDQATGHVTGPAMIDYNSPWPCENGSDGSGAMMGVVMHTMVGNLPGTVSWFNDRQSGVSSHFGIAQDGLIHQFGPIGKDWCAWAQAAGNIGWYSIEHADDQDPANPLTDAQIVSSAQLVEVLSRFAGFPLNVTDHVGVKGYGTHSMGGVAWGDHPGCPGPVRAAQRLIIVTLAHRIRAATVTPIPELEGILVTLPSGASRKVLSHDSGKTWA